MLPRVEGISNRSVNVGARGSVPGQRRSPLRRAKGSSGRRSRPRSNASARAGRTPPPPTRGERGTTPRSSMCNTWWGKKKCKQIKYSRMSIETQLLQNKFQFLSSLSNSRRLQQGSSFSASRVRTSIASCARSSTRALRLPTSERRTESAPWTTAPTPRSARACHLQHGRHVPRMLEQGRGHALVRRGHRLRAHLRRSRGNGCLFLAWKTTFDATNRRLRDPSSWVP